MSDPEQGVASDDLAALIEFYLEAGVDAALADDPVDRFAESAQRVQRRAPAPRDKAVAPVRQSTPSSALQERPGAAQTDATVPGEGAIDAARLAANSAQSLDELREALAGFEGCNLRMTAKNLVFADGNPESRLMLVGEAPGRDEDRIGLPFVGRSGKLLDLMLNAIGLGRDAVYIANVVPWRPPGNRTPSPTETEICKPFICRQIELANPDILVFLGGASAKQLTGAREGITRLRGKWLTYQGRDREIRAMATLHPAYLLRQPLQKNLAWRDFLTIKAALDEMNDA